MKTALKMYGPLHVGILSTNDLYDSVADMEANYKGPAVGTDHEVVIVGYVDDSSLSYGGYWIIRIVGTPVGAAAAMGMFLTCRRSA